MTNPNRETHRLDNDVERRKIEVSGVPQSLADR